MMAIYLFLRFPALVLKAFSGARTLIIEILDSMYTFYYLKITIFLNLKLLEDILICKKLYQYEQE
jgi:hypothetical protein